MLISALASNPIIIVWFLISNMNSTQKQSHLHIFTISNHFVHIRFDGILVAYAILLAIYPLFNVLSLRRGRIFVWWTGATHILLLRSNIFNIYVTFNWKFLFEKCTWNYHVNRWARNTKSNERRFYSILLAWYSKWTELSGELQETREHVPSHTCAAISMRERREKKERVENFEAFKLNICIEFHLQ